MKVVYPLTYIMALVFIVGETARRGISYMSVNATTMFEDYFCGAFLLVAALLTLKKHRRAPKFMLAAWAYATGGMFVPFFAHLEAWLRGVTVRPDHPHEDVNSVITKGIILAICLACLVATLRNSDGPRQLA
jgi:uncharacterized membrane protein